ncbi:lipid-A-disaccharide synthase [Planctomycetota bacterium]
MTQTQKPYRIFISAAEPSGDSHCAGLINAIREADPDVEFTGVGGPKMAEAGCELLANSVQKAAMAHKAFAQAGYFLKLIIKIKRLLRTQKPDLVILCDSPAFNFHIAKAAKKQNIKTLFYVAPQLWAWAPWRIRKLRKCCDKLCCILPFEQQWFTQRAVDTTFVGNPLLDGLQNIEQYKKDYTNFDPSSAHIAIMPGSRTAEIDSLWKPMQLIGKRLKKKYPRITFTTVAVDQKRKEKLRSLEMIGFKCNYAIGSVPLAARNADFTIVASGSATLQVAAAGCPMVIMYQSSRLVWHLLGWWLIKTNFLSLVNILAGCQLVPEFMPYFKSIDPIVNTIEKLLENRTTLTQTSTDLIRLTTPLAKSSAAKKTAKIAKNLLNPQTF